ncbi:MAG: MFS transporter, partial [Gammaproteobacteria bacterium]|nr:MFS transporter [Gammaproteobacteria bacterium]
MTSIMTSIIALLFSAAVMLVGHGLQLTLAPLYANSLGWSDTVIGFMGSTYFGGFVIGCLTIPHLVAQVGHIRVYTVLIALATTALLLLGLVQEPMIWYLARMVTGWSLAGLYMIIESWLNERSPSAQRARVLSVYTIITLIAICAGQLLVGLKMNYLQMILLAAIFLALGTIPVGLTRSPPPSPIPPVSFSLAAVYRASHIAVLGAFAGGLVTAGFWSLGPIMALAQGIAVEDIGLFMSVTILGGAVFQFPLGRLSDQRDRRLVLMLIALTGALVCALSLLITLPENQKMIYL